MIKIFLIFLLTSCLTFGCKDELMPDPAPAAWVGTGETVPVTLSFDQTGFNASVGSPMRSGDAFPVAKASSPDMDVELTAVPDTAAWVATRTGEPDADHTIWGYYVLQFDGVVNSSVLRSMQHVDCPEGVIDTKTIRLYRQSAKQRIVVITNLPDGFLDQKHLSGLFPLKVGKSLYQDLSRLYFEWSDFSSFTSFPLFSLFPSHKDVMISYGETDVVLTDSSQVQVTIPLMRTVSKATFNIQVQDTLRGKYDMWSVGLYDVAFLSYLYPYRRSGSFPSIGAWRGYGSRSLLYQFRGDDLPLKPVYLAINLKPDVPVASLYDRVLHAPKRSCYLRIIGERFPNKVGLPQAIYRIYLGLNFAESYSIPPNYNLNYTIRLKGYSQDDPSVVPSIAGYFSGGMKAWDAAGTEVSLTNPSAVKFRYAKRMEMYGPSIGMMYPSGDDPTTSYQIGPWYDGDHIPPEGCENITSWKDGFQNTHAIFSFLDLKNYVPLYSCYRIVGSWGIKYDTPAYWYAPSAFELIGLWVAGLMNYTFFDDTGGKDEEDGLSYSIWSSTVTAADSACLGRKDGFFGNDVITARNSVRAVRQIN